MKIFLHRLNLRKKADCGPKHFLFQENTAFKNWIVDWKHAFQMITSSLMSSSAFKSLVIIIVGLFSDSRSRFEQLPQMLLPGEPCSRARATKNSLDGQAEKSTDLPILLNLWLATDSNIWRISGYSSTTSLKSSACRMKMSHKVLALTLAVRLALVNRQISGIKTAHKSVKNGGYREAQMRRRRNKVKMV